MNQQFIVGSELGILFCVIWCFVEANRRTFSPDRHLLRKPTTFGSSALRLLCLGYKLSNSVCLNRLVVSFKGRSWGSSWMWGLVWWSVGGTGESRIDGSGIWVSSWSWLGDVMRRRSKFRVIAVLFLLAILLGGSAAISFMVSGIFLALTVLVILCLLMLLVVVAHFSKKKK